LVYFESCTVTFSKFGAVFCSCSQHINAVQKLALQQKTFYSENLRTEL